MTEEQLRELVKSVRFFNQRKEAYTYEDTIQIEDQLKNKIAGEIAKVISKEFEGMESKLTELDGTVKTKEAELTQFQKDVEEAKSRTLGLDKEVEAAKATIAGFERKEEKRVATELLDGMVFAGAELDVYKELGDSIKKITFEEGATLEEKQAQIKPLIDGIVEVKPYFKKTGEAKKKASDNAGLITKEKIKVETDEEKRKELFGEANSEAIGGLVL